jgi:hypothetical protein
MHTADGLIVAELSLTDWLHAAFAAERAPQRPKRSAVPARGAGRIVGGARVTFWWMLGITLLAVALR